MLSKDDILNADDLPSEVVEVPEWGGSVIVRTLTGSERDAFEMSCVRRVGKSTTQDLKNIRAKLVVRAVVSDDGKRLFADGEVELLGKKSSSALDRLYDVAARLSGIREEDIEELAKNSTSGQSEDSG